MIGNAVLLSPGSANANAYVGSLAFNTATFGLGGGYTFDVATASGVAGTDYDTISVAGTLTVTATSGNPFAINVESINPGTGAPGLASFNPALSYQWTLASASSVAGFSAADFSLNGSAFANSLGTGNFFVSSNGSDIFLNFTPVPEPSTWALAGSGLAALAAASLWRRRAALRRASAAI